MTQKRSFSQAQKIFDDSVLLSKTWASKNYPHLNLKINGVSLERVQAFSQHHFFTFFLEGKHVVDTWSRYPNFTLGSKKRTLFALQNFLFKIAQVIGDLFSGKAEVHLKNSQLVILSSGRHLADLKKLISALNDEFKILVVGKISNEMEEFLTKKQIPFVNIVSGLEYLSRRERLTYIIKFSYGTLKSKNKNKTFTNKNWRDRLWYLSTKQFPEMVGLISLASRIFEQTQPKLLLTTSSNDIVGASFSLTAKKAKVQIAELQHGFSSWPSDRAFSNNDYYLTWGEIPLKIYRGEHKKLVVGSPADEWMKNIRKKEAKQVRRVLVLLSPPIGVVYSFRYKENDFVLKKLITGLAKFPKDIKITIRTHPSYNIESDLRGLRLPRNVKTDNREKLKQVIEKHDVIIAQPTTAALIAVRYNKPMLSFDNSWLTKNYGNPFTSSGSAVDVDLNDLGRIDELVYNLVMDRTLLENQRIAQNKFFKEYIGCFGEKSISKLLKFVEGVVGQDAKE